MFNSVASRNLKLIFIPSVVSLALGRPFAIQDDDITVEVSLTSQYAFSGYWSNYSLAICKRKR
jgi:hypothetical protein